MGGRRVIGVDAGGTKLLVGAVDEDLRVHRRARRLWDGADREGVLRIIEEAVGEVRQAAPDAEVVGFGIPSLIDRASGVSVSSAHLPLEDMPFRDEMERRLGLPAELDNDSNAALIAEHRHGAARGAEDAVMLTLGTGIGGGVVAGGRVLRGSVG